MFSENVKYLKNKTLQLEVTFHWFKTVRMFRKFCENVKTFKKQKLQKVTNCAFRLFKTLKMFRKVCFTTRQIF